MPKAANNISTTKCILFANIGQNTAVKYAHEYERKITTKTNQGTKKAQIKGPSKYITQKY